MGLLWESNEIACQQCFNDNKEIKHGSITKHGELPHNHITPTNHYTFAVSGPLKAAMRLGQEVMSGDNDYPSNLFKGS